MAARLQDFHFNGPTPKQNNTDADGRWVGSQGDSGITDEVCTEVVPHASSLVPFGVYALDNGARNDLCDKFGMKRKPADAEGPLTLRVAM